MNLVHGKHCSYDFTIKGGWVSFWPILIDRDGRCRTGPEYETTYKKAATLEIGEAVLKELLSLQCCLGISYDDFLYNDTVTYLAGRHL